LAAGLAMLLVDGLAAAAGTAIGDGDSLMVTAMFPVSDCSARVIMYLLSREPPPRPAESAHFRPR